MTLPRMGYPLLEWAAPDIADKIEVWYNKPNAQGRRNMGWKNAFSREE